MPDEADEPSEPRPTVGFWWRLLFPDPPRAFSAQRALKIGLRAGHVLCAGTLVGAFQFGPDEATRTRWLIATACSGALLLLLDWIETSAFFLQLRGWVVLTKMGLLCLLPTLGASGYPLLATMLVVSVISSHAPSRLRYCMPFGADRIQGSSSKG